MAQPDTEGPLQSQGRLSAAFQRFIHMEASGGIMLGAMAILALMVANSPLLDPYYYVLKEVYFRIGFAEAGNWDFEINKSVLLWINDGLMALFFFLVGLEIKREVKTGALSSPKNALLPAIAAIGGMAVPAGFYILFNHEDPEFLHGWAIPAATDIAFALGILSLVRSRVPPSLKILLTAIAVIDDLLAIIIIALFYSANIAIAPLYFAAAALAGLFLLNRANHMRMASYVILGVVLWVAVLQSGIHATLAGVVAALFIPMHNEKTGKSPVKHLEHALHPWIAFAVLPIFAFANAGVPFAGMGLADLLHPVTLGIACGLFIGKQIGIFTLLWATIKLGLSPMPYNATWTQLYGVALLCGVGFTMSLFIGGLAFSDISMSAYIRMGVLCGSLLSGVCGYLLLRYGPSKVVQENAKT